VTPESALHLEKAFQCLNNARISLDVNLGNDAGRSAYLAAFHAAQAYIIEKTGRFTKTHQGVQVEFHRLAHNEPGMDRIFPAFLSQAYNLKAVADYELGPDADIPLDYSAKAIETARRFVECIAQLISR
jgi:uncharacterized protein (UPF0332 family)